MIHTNKNVQFSKNMIRVHTFHLFISFPNFHRKWVILTTAWKFRECIGVLTANISVISDKIKLSTNGVGSWCKFCPQNAFNTAFCGQTWSGHIWISIVHYDSFDWKLKDGADINRALVYFKRTSPTVHF